MTRSDQSTAVVSGRGKPPGSPVDRGGRRIIRIDVHLCGWKMEGEGEGERECAPCKGSVSIVWVSVKKMCVCVND